MSSAIYEQIRRNPKFTELVQRRSRLAWILVIAVMVIFYGLILTIAFNPAMMGIRLGEGSMVTLGVVTIFTMFVLFWALTALYVSRANGEFDRLTHELIKDATKGGRK
ncbi:MAG: hypothetical protein RLY71_4287 [Pseudomonadota bacterium]|jgi:cation/acetate symporter